MPEPGIDDRNFNRPITDRDNPRRNSRPRLKLPGQYAEFRLEDGRYLGDVMGPDFFGPETGSNGGRPISDSERQRIRDENYPLAGMFRFRKASAPDTEERSPEFAQDNPDADDRPPRENSNAEGTPTPEEQEVAAVEQSRAAGISPPPFEMTPPLPRIQARRDPAGGWNFTAPRAENTRQHNAVDLLAEPGTPVRSPIDGTVHRINYTTTGMATILLGNDAGQEVKLLYVAPVDGQGNQLLEPGATVRADQIIGSVEDLGEGYGDARTGRMKNHVHMEVSENGQRVDPLPWLAQWWANPEGSGKNWHPRRHSVAPGTGNAPDYDAESEGRRWRREREPR